MKIHQFVLLFIIFITILSCSEKNQEIPEPVTFDTLFDSKYNLHKILIFAIHRKIEIEGYLSIKGTTSLHTKTLNLAFSEKQDNSGRSISANIRIGNGPNQVEMLPKFYSKDELKIHTNKNEIIGADVRVKLTGKRFCPKDNTSCYIIVEEIEKAE